MFTNCAIFKCVIDGKEYFYICPNDAPISTYKESLFYFQKCIGHIEDNIKAQQEAAKKEQEEKPVEVIPEAS